MLYRADRRRNLVANAPRLERFVRTSAGIRRARCSLARTCHAGCTSAVVLPLRSGPDNVSELILRAGDGFLRAASLVPAGGLSA